MFRVKKRAIKHFKQTTNKTVALLSNLFEDRLSLSNFLPKFKNRSPAKLQN